MAITNLTTTLTSAGNTGTAGDYSSAGTSVFQITYSNIGYIPSTVNAYENDFGEELRVFVNGIRIYRLSTDTVGDDTTLSTEQKNRLDALNTSVGKQPWTIDSTNSRIQINTDSSAWWGDDHTDNCGYPALSAWTIVKVVRIKSDKTALTSDFQNASVLTEKQLDNAFLETFHIAQEAFDKTASGSLNKDTDDVWNASNTRIKNVTDPVNNQDVATKAWVNSNANTTTVAGSIGNVNHVAGQISPTNNISTVATSVTAGHIATVAGDTTEIGKVAGKETEIGRLGASAYADGADAYLAKLGVDSMSNATTGNIKKVADVATEVGVVAESTYKGKVETVADSTYKGKVETVADSTYKGKVETVADSTYKGKVETVADSTYKGKVETVADSTYKGKVETVAGSTYKTKVEAVAGAVDNVNNFANTYFGAHANDTAVASHISTNSLTLGAGDLYYNTTSNSIESYNGSSWESMKTVVGGSTVTSADGSNLTLTTVADGENVVINSTTGTSGNTIVLPKVRASTNNYVLAMSDKTTGATTWQATSTASTITGVSGELNTYENSAEDGGTLTLTGTDFGTDASAINSIKIMKSDGTNEVSASSFGTPTGTGGTSIPDVVFNGSETNYNTFPADTTWYIEVTKSSLASNRFSSGKSFTKDPTISAITQSVASADYNSGFTGTSGHFGSYGGGNSGGGTDSNTKLLLNFDRSGGTDIEDSSNSGGDGHKVTATNASIKSSPFGDGKSAMFFDGTADKLTIPFSNDFHILNGVNTGADFTVEFWMQMLLATSNWQGILDFYDYDGTASNRTGWRIYNYDADSLYFDMVGGVGGIHYEEGFDLNTWYHLAFVRSGNTLTMYKNGVSTGDTYTTNLSGNNLNAPANTTSLSVGVGTDGSGTLNKYFNGYLDEIRIVKGSAVYTGDFTPPTSRLSATQSNQGTNIADITGTATKLLIHSNQSDDASVNQFPLTSIPTQTTTGSRSAWGGSHYDVTGQGPLIPANPGFNLTGKDFCIEFWVKDKGSAPFASNDKLFHFGTGPLLYWETANAIQFSVTGASNAYVFNPNNDDYNNTSNSWSHIALTRVNSTNTWTLYTDGVAASTAINSAQTSLDFSADSLQFFSDHGGSGNNATGYFEDIRLTVNNAVYSGADTTSANFTLPTGPLTTTWSAGTNISANSTASNVVFLLHGNGAKFDDSSPTTGGRSVHTITPTGSYHSQGHKGIAPAMAWPTSKKATGSAGVYFGSSTGKLELASPPVLGTGAFTIDFWANPSSTQNGSPNGDWYFLLDLRGGDGGIAPIVYMHKSNYQLRLTHGNSGSVLMSPSSDTALTLDTWQHLAFVREGTGSNQAKFYINGYLKATYTDATDWTATGSDSLGGNYNGDHAWNGYIDLYRHSNIARWTSAFNTNLPTKIYGAFGPENPSIGTIELTTATEDDVNVTYSFQGSTEDNASVLGSSSDLAIASDTTGANKKKGTLTGTLQGTAGSVTNLRIQAKANNDANRLVEVNETSGVGAVSLTKVSSGRSVLFNARRYVGSDTVRDLTFGFQPDLCWFKERDSSNNHQLMDSIRGGSEIIYPNHNYSKADRSGNHGFVKSFNPDGITLSSDTDDHGINRTGEPTICWSWKAGGSGSPLSGSSNIGGLSSVTQSVNTAGDFSITKYNGATSGDCFFKHGLSGKPDFVIVKSTSDALNWYCWHSGLNSGASGAGDFILLNEGKAKATRGDGVSGSSDNHWSAQISTGFDSDKITLSANTGPTNADSKTYICYAWKAVANISAFGTYEGTGGAWTSGNNGGAIDVGFKPRFVMVKNVDNAGSWQTYDSFREPSDTKTTAIWADESAGENSDADYTIVFNDTGFKYTAASVNGSINTSGSSYIYMAFA